MSSNWVTAVAALGGTVVGGSITLVGQELESRRRARTDRQAALVAILNDLAEGAAAVRIQANSNNRSILRTVLLRVVFSGVEPFATIATDWLAAFDDAFSMADAPPHIERFGEFEARMVQAARKAGTGIMPD